MPTFAFVGRTRGGETIAGERAGETMDAVVSLLRREQVLVTKVTPVKVKAEGGTVKKGKLGKSASAKSLAIFVRQFSVMIDAGLPLVQCLEILGTQEEDPSFAATILQTRSDVENGQSLADAMRKHPKTFDPLFTNMIAAGEAGGILDTILKRLATYIEKAVKLKSQVKSAMIYPIAVVSIATVVVAAILWKVIPTFAGLFSSLGAELPMPTRVVIAMSNSLVRFGWMIIIALGVLGWFLKQFYATSGGRRTIDRIVLGPPILGNIMREDRRRAVLPHAGDPDQLGRADSRRPRDHGAHVGQRDCRRRHHGDPEEHRRRRTPSPRRSARPTSFPRWSCR